MLLFKAKICQMIIHPFRSFYPDGGDEQSLYKSWPMVNSPGVLFCSELIWRQEKRYFFFLRECMRKMRKYKVFF